MKTRSIYLASLFLLAIPSAASAETALVEATVIKAGKRTPVAAFTLDVAGDGSPTSAEAAGQAERFEVDVRRLSGKAPRLRFQIDIQRGRAGRFKLSTSREIQHGSRTVIGAFRQASGELLEVAVTTSP